MKQIVIAFGGLGPEEMLLILFVLLVFVIITVRLIIRAFVKTSKKIDTQDQQSRIRANQHLGNCRACNGQVSINATSCPHCGDPSPIS